MRVAVIGAGPSGLVTVKELLEEGHAPTCFEAAGEEGSSRRPRLASGRIGGLPRRPVISAVASLIDADPGIDGERNADHVGK